MANYNPGLPQILGQEWVPIRDVDLQLTNAANSIELGTSFYLPSSELISDARFYVNEFPGQFISKQTFTMNLYQKGMENETGPIRSVVIPCNAGAVTGSNVFIDTASTVAEALLDPSDRSTIAITSATDTFKVSMFFAVNQYAQLLANKRILGVNLLYSGEASNVDPAYLMWVSLEPNVGFTTNTDDWRWPVFGLNGPAFNPGQVNRISFGDTNPFFGSNSTRNTTAMPWTFSELARLDNPSSASRLGVYFFTPFSSTPVFGAPTIFWDYAALEVIYCEENRLAAGSFLFSPPAPALAAGSFNRTGYYTLGANGITMRTVPGGATSPNVGPGALTLTLAEGNLGDEFTATGNTGPQPTLNVTRQLYSISSFAGVQINVPTPLPESLGETFTVEETQEVIQLSLQNITSDPLKQVHVYGRQTQGQVYGTVTVTQDILDAISSGNASFDQVRYYARRFGNTTSPLVLSSPTITGSGAYVSLTPPEWDALPEIVDGWKEITLTFPTPVTMGAGTNPQWKWTATSETAGNRWEVLGAAAPAMSGVPGNLLQKYPAAGLLGPSTYGEPSAGDTINEGWINGISPLVSATTDDSMSDAVLLFSQLQAPITGFTITNQTQALSGIGTDCGVAPCGIPTSLDFNQLNWVAPSGIVFDDFEARTVSSGWGFSSSGRAWTVTGGSASDYSVSGGSGFHSLGSVSSIHRSSIGSNIYDSDQSVTVTIPALATGGDIAVGILSRLSALGNFYFMELRSTSTGTTTLSILKSISGTDFSIISTSPFSIIPTAPLQVKLRFQTQGTALRAKAWLASQVEPETWDLEDSDSVLTSGGNGVRSRLVTGNTNTLPMVITFDDYEGVPFGGQYELQRNDDLDATWQTVMLANDLTTTVFNDYEARVGLASNYRIRQLNSYGFAGPWSSTLTATVPDPGVTIGCLGNGHLMIFTSNERQDGSINLAYSNAWQGHVTEDFQFLEAASVQLQTMYNRDFTVAFRPLERGGDRFQRVVLVQAAAISPETLPGFTSLSDMAWDTVSYICVRDEDGNRWYATVLVPYGSVQRSRKLYLANVDIVEVTDTPSEVDP